MVRAMKSIDEPVCMGRLGRHKEPPMECQSQFYMVRLPCFRVRYSLGKSCMTLFWIRWSLHSVPVYHDFIVFGNTSGSLWQMQLSFSIYKKRSSSPLSSTALCLKNCFRVLSAFCMPTISSLQFAKH